MIRYLSNMSPLDVVVYIFSSLAVVILTLPIHEFAHAYAAVKLGDKTPKWQGRLTLNPFAHIDWIGAVCVIFFGIGWAKPVNINPNNFKNPKRDMAITAFAGPLSNIILGFICLLVSNAVFLLFRAFQNVFIIYVAAFFSRIAEINIYLAVFNLIPIPPFDGSRLLSVFLPYKYYYALMRYERYIFWGVLVLLATGVLSGPIGFVSDKIYSFLAVFAGIPFKFFN